MLLASAAEVDACPFFLRTKWLIAITTGSLAPALRHPDCVFWLYICLFSSLLCNLSWFSNSSSSVKICAFAKLSTAIARNTFSRVSDARLRKYAILQWTLIITSRDGKNWNFRERIRNKQTISRRARISLPFQRPADALIFKIRRNERRVGIENQNRS